ncbi:MAG TPA: hypothetical protein VJ617_13960, partial [Arthrobacter sp.]|nr:hypothetical protein [Arthrobacter sp.]
GLRGSAISRDNPPPAGFVPTLSKGRIHGSPGMLTAHHLEYESTKNVRISYIYSMVLGFLGA